LAALSTGEAARLRDAARERFLTAAKHCLAGEATPARLAPLHTALTNRAHTAPPTLTERLQLLHERTRSLLGLEPRAALRRPETSEKLLWRQVGEALLVPPAAAQIPGELEELDTWWRHSEGPAVAIVQAGVMVHALLNLQPLESFNELVIYLTVLESLTLVGANPSGLLTMQHFWSRPTELQRALDDGIWSGDITRWLELFTSSIADEMDEIVRSARAVSEAREVDHAQLNDRQMRALSHIRTLGRMTNRDYRKLFNVSNKTAHQELRLMVDRKVIRRLGFGRSVEYVA
jgi:hypothetical protein